MAANRQLNRIMLLMPYLSDASIAREDVLDALGVNSLGDLAKEVARITSLDSKNSRFAESVQVLIQKNSVSMMFSHFKRPMRLTVDELHALELGLNILKSESAPAEHKVIENAISRLAEIRVNGGDRSVESRMYASLGETTKNSVLDAVHKARKELKKLEIEYISTANGATKRIICPYGALFSQGRWYVIAFCERSNERRMFRADRIISVLTTDDRYDTPEAFSIDQLYSEHKALSNQPASFMRVRYSPVVARWIAEREGIELNEDGSLEFEHPLFDSSWAVSHVLQYGAEAEVLSPPEIRSLVRETLRGMVLDESY